MTAVNQDQVNLLDERDERLRPQKLRLGGEGGQGQENLIRNFDG